MTLVSVEVAFGSTLFTPVTDMVWTDITSRVDVKEVGITGSRGAADELADTQVGTYSMLLDNSDGAFSPGLSSSPYYPNVRKGTPIRVRVQTGEKNWVPNPTFEVGTEYWSPSGSQTIIQSVVRAHDGAASMRISWTAVSSQSVRTPLEYLTAGATYTASAWVWVPAGAQAIRLKAADEAGTDIQLGALSTVTDAWQRITVTWAATAPDQQLRISPTGTPAAGQQVWVDSVQVEAGAVASAFDPVPIRIHHRFWGAVNDWPVKWKGLYATARITCSDLMAPLSRQPQLRSALDEEVLENGPIAYYPLTEDSGSTSAGDLSGIVTGALSVVQIGGTGGTLDFGSGAAPAATRESYPQFTPTSATVGKFLFADLGDEYERLSAARYNTVEGWFSTTTGGRVILGLESVDLQYQLCFSLSAGGIFQVESTIDGPGPLTVLTSGSGNLADGAMHHFVYDEWSSGLWIDGVSKSLGFPGTMFDLRKLAVGAFRSTRLWSGSVGGVALYTTSGGPRGPDLLDHYTAGATGFAGEDADARIQRIARYGKVASVTILGSVHDPVASQGEGGATALAMMRAVEKSEAGRLYAERDWIGMAYQSRDVRYNPSPAEEVFTISYADLETDDVELTDDDQKLTNTVVAQRPGGARQRIISQPSIDRYGPYDPGEMTLLKTSDAAVAAAANWIVSRYADPPPELREIPVEAYTMPNYADILDGEISEYFTVTDLPAESDSSEQRVTIEGYTETIKQSSHLIKFHTSRSANDSVWILGDSVYSVLGSTTRLAY
ncbi:carbohydrate binding domain-containing protein [Streptomyces sp. PSRA5]|uniref:carbohydrate binding domain-containing protein n=1 Tax=Streptomyces panacea TaxID=3035064 RepID=UPI00339D0F1A